ncbi:MAG: SAP domain-containing protein [Colwellia sp.]|nr:SAP domain-containing protein [Colwellia sp.]
MNFPITYSNFCQQLVSKYESDLQSYESARAWRTVFRMSLEDSREICIFLKIGSRIESRYKSAVGDRRLCCIESDGFSGKDPNNNIVFTFVGSDDPVNIPKKYVSSFVKKILEDSNENTRLATLLDSLPNLTKQQKQFKKNKQNYFSNQDNWDTIVMLFESFLLKSKKRSISDAYISPCDDIYLSFLRYFPFDFASSNDRTAVQFLETLINKFFSICPKIKILIFYGQTLSLSVGTDCEDYLLGLLSSPHDTPVSSSDFSNYIEKNYYFPLNKYSFSLKQYLVFDNIFSNMVLGGNKFNCKVLKNINPNVPISEYINIVNSVYHRLGLPVDPTIEEALEMESVCEDIDIGYWYYWKHLCSCKNKFVVSKEFIIEKLHEWDLTNDKFKYPLRYLIQYYTEEGQYVKTLFDELISDVSNQCELAINFLKSIHYNVIVDCNKIIENYDYIDSEGNSIIMLQADDFINVKKLLVVGINNDGKYWCNLGQINNKGQNIIDILCSINEFDDRILGTCLSIIMTIIKTGECVYSEKLFEKACMLKIVGGDDYLVPIVLKLQESECQAIITQSGSFNENMVLHHISLGIEVSDINLMYLLCNKMNNAIAVLPNVNEIFDTNGCINPNIMNRIENILRSFNNNNLKNLLKFRSLKYSGTKKVLIKRITDYISVPHLLSGPEQPSQIDDSLVPDNDTPSNDIVMVKQSATGIQPQNLTLLTCKTLESILSNFKVKVSGTKAVKIARINSLKDFSSQQKSLNLSKIELREMAKNIDLMVSGSKGELIERLLKINNYFTDDRILS